jgi:feruloyl esterase
VRLWNGIDRAALIHAPISPANWAAPFFGGEAPDADGFSFAAFEKLFDEFVERYGAVMDTSSPALSSFAKRGGKTIIWHGVADDIIPAAGSVHYVESIRRALGSRATDTFLRFYLAPGVGHCGGSDGPQPVALFESLMEWVEHGPPPMRVRSENWDQAGIVTRTRPLCPYPEYARYRGRGSLDDAASFRCQK